jgi:hypothetical protein
MVENLPGYGQWKVLRTRKEGGLTQGEVYVYSYPCYIELATLKNESSYPVKIGMTALTADERIAEQTTTAMPEFPLLLHTFKTPTPRALERALHGILESRGQVLESRVGSEWFRSSSDEVAKLVEWIDGR